MRDSFNAVFIEGGAVGELRAVRPQVPAARPASAVLGATSWMQPRTWSRDARGATIGTLALKPIRAIDDVESQFYLMMEVPDRPGVLHAISGVFAEHGVSIRSMQQRERGDDARLVFVTHKAKESDLRATVRALRDVEQVHRVGAVLRVIGEEE